MKPKGILQFGIGIIAAAALMLPVPFSEATMQDEAAGPDKAAFISALIYRPDDTGDHTFAGGSLNGTTINEDGAVEYTASPGRYEIKTPYDAEGVIYSVTLNWEFTGQVAMEVSTTGKDADYEPIINGVPLEQDASNAGDKIMWRATLAPGSALTEVKITYSDLSGVLGDFGAPELSGFMFRKPIYVAGTSAGELFHYQLPVRVGESSGAADCDFYLMGSILSDFGDVRFTRADRATLIPYYLESIKGYSPNRTALFWINIPQLPEEGTLLYFYYGNESAETLSTTDVFDLFDDFDGAALDMNKWTAELEADFSMVELSDSLLRLDAAKVTSNYKLRDGIIEYKARTGGGPIAAALRGDIMFYSSNAGETEHCIAVGDDVKENTEKPVTLGALYRYKIAAYGGDITFQRLDESGATLLAETEYVDPNAPGLDKNGLTSTPGLDKNGLPIQSGSGSQTEPISLHAASQGLFVYYDWIRARKLAIPAPEIDAARTKAAQEEIPNIPEFTGTTVAPNGDLTLSGASEGSYVSSLVSAPFQVRVIVPSWSLRGAAAGGEAISIDISAKEDNTFSENCKNGAHYYASKGDFAEGDALRLRARFNALSTPGLDKNGLTSTPGLDKNGLPGQSGSGSQSEAISITALSLDFRPGAINIVLPNGGEYLKIGTDYDIVWDAPDYESSYKFGVAYSTDGGGTYETIAKKTKNSGRHAWTVPDLISTPGLDKSGLASTPGLDKNGLPRQSGSGRTYNKCVVKVYDALDHNIYDISNANFSIGTEPPEEEEEEEEAAEEEAAPAEEEEDRPTEKGGRKLYEVLMKKQDTVVTEGEDDSGAYRKGDIVMIKPKGHLWGASERRNFVIVEVYLTEQEREDFMKPETKLVRSEDGQPAFETVRRRKHRLNLDDEKIKEKIAAMKNILRTKPLIDVKDIERKK